VADGLLAADALNEPASTPPATAPAATSAAIMPTRVLRR